MKEQNLMKATQEQGITLTALEIHNHEFDHKLFGYNQDQVNEFIDVIIKDYQAYENIIKALQEEIKRLSLSSPWSETESADSLLNRVRDIEFHLWGKYKG